jgi:L-iditol 2-dehydrogenase
MRHRRFRMPHVEDEIIYVRKYKFMKALVLEKYNELTLKDIPTPEIEDNDVLIRVKACSICGSDVHGYDGSSGRRIPSIVMGHEASGIIEKTGCKVKGFEKGDDVVFNSTLFCGECYYCRRGKQNMCLNGKVYGVSCEGYRLQGAMAEFIAVPYHILYKIPKGVSYEEAALVEPLSIALHAVNCTPINLNDTAVVFGAGTIGLMITKLLALSSCGKIIAVDVDELKLEHARECGAHLCLNPRNCSAAEEIIKATDGRGADIAFEAVGIPDTTISGIECLKKGGQFTLVGNISPNINLPVQKVVLRELNLVGAYCCANEYETSLNLISSKAIKVNDLISAVVPLEKGQEMFDRLHKSEKGLMKIILTP